MLVRMELISIIMHSNKTTNSRELVDYFGKCITQSFVVRYWFLSNSSRREAEAAMQQTVAVDPVPVALFVSPVYDTITDVVGPGGVDNPAYQAEATKTPPTSDVPTGHYEALRRTYNEYSDLRRPVPVLRHPGVMRPVTAVSAVTSNGWDEDWEEEDDRENYLHVRTSIFPADEA